MKNGRILENVVMTGTPQEVADICRALDERDYFYPALGLACRFRGVEYVRALAENGASFDHSASSEWLTPLDINERLHKLPMFLDECFSNSYRVFNKNGTVVETVDILPIEKRVEIVRYLCENSKRLCFPPEDLLFYAILSNNRLIVAALKEMGVTLSKGHTIFLTKIALNLDWVKVCLILDSLEDGEIVDVMRNLIGEFGKLPVNFVNCICRGCRRHLDKQFFGFVIDNCEFRSSDKARYMKAVIDRNNTSCFELFAERGWLKRPELRDEMIAYASENNRTECVAWLLDYKNRTADLAAERVRAERKVRRELNADPNSVSVLRQIWSWKKQDDGTLVITSYKGDRTEISVPSRIGDSVVSAIGEKAFSAAGVRAKLEHRRIRQSITGVTLPDSIRTIGASAFFLCGKLEKINIPEGVEKIGGGAFGSCKSLSEIAFPDSVRELESVIFYECNMLRSVRLPAGIAAIPVGLFASSGIREIALPETVRVIGATAFHLCAELSAIHIPQGVAEIGESAFSGCEKLAEVIVPDSVKKLGHHLFSYCTALRSVKLPKGITVIGEGMFRQCASLRSVELPAGIRSIDRMAFYECESLEKIVVPRGTVEIGQKAFAKCGAFRTVVIPATVRRIADHKTEAGTETVFHGSDNVTVVVEPNSFAEEYCRQNKIAFEYGTDGGEN